MNKNLHFSTCWILVLISVGATYIFLASLGLTSIACTSPTSLPTPVPPATVRVNNNSSYPVTMGLDGGTAVPITAGGSYIFNDCTGNHTFAATSSTVQYPSYSCPGTIQSCISTFLAANAQHVLYINNYPSGGTVTCSGIPYSTISWQCPP